MPPDSEPGFFWQGHFYPAVIGPNSPLPQGAVAGFRYPKGANGAFCRFFNPHEQTQQPAPQQPAAQSNADGAGMLEEDDEDPAVARARKKLETAGALGEIAEAADELEKRFGNLFNRDKKDNSVPEGWMRVGGDNGPVVPIDPETGGPKLDFSIPVLLANGGIVKDVLTVLANAVGDKAKEVIETQNQAVKDQAKSEQDVIARRRAALEVAEKELAVKKAQQEQRQRDIELAEAELRLRERGEQVRATTRDLSDLVGQGAPAQAKEEAKPVPPPRPPAPPPPPPAPTQAPAQAPQPAQEASLEDGAGMLGDDDEEPSGGRGGGSPVASGDDASPLAASEAASPLH
jgi:hypothetical protein